MRLVPVVLCILVAGSASSAAAEPWYRGPHGKNRVLHLSLAAGFGLGFVASETVLKPTLAPDDCRWCAPPSIDVRVRDALVWDDYDRARSLSNWTGYVALPLFGVGISALGALQADDASWGRLIDDTIPILETVAISQLLTQAIKFSVGRARPLVHFRDVPADTDNNLSFFSGHSALTFGITTSAALLARWRGSRTEPVIWGVGLSLSVSTAYLRIAADKHYFTDVVTGSLVGIAAGLTIPRLMRRHGDIAIVPAPNGAALVGAF